mmetsp:Transcript_25813/g.39657  ORF Transcript_25813/g.39657 Transcript_25813/m.39657 type:complete len:267 (-) Transcript_25813:28-828(-)
MLPTSSLSGFLIGTLLATQGKESSICPISLEVCLSPGCVSDGGEATLRKLQALAPPDRLTVKSGTCVSACGNGPVVRQDEKIIHKRVVAENDFLESLLGEPSPEELVKGYDLVCDAEIAAAEGRHEDAIDLLEKGIQPAIQISMSRVNEAIRENGMDDMSALLPSPSLQWLITGYQSLAKAKLQVQDLDGALEAVEKACEMANGSDPLAWELMATVCEARKDIHGEMKALQALFALPVKEKLPQDVQNRRRTLGFRLAKLERESSL